MSTTPTQHVPVMPAEVLAGLQPQPGQVMVDCTMGGGGHTRLLAEQVGPEGLVIALDRDPAAVAAAEERLRGLPIKTVVSNYSDVPEILEQLGITAVNGILMDLGLSSDQLADRERGFSFESEGPLDLRFNPEQGKPAWKLIERLGADDLADMIYAFGEERMSRRIAREIVARRHHTPIRTSRQLAEIVRGCVPRARHAGAIDSATRTFQALRIAVNDELKWLDVALERLPKFLVVGGRLAAISFHSLEDRRVKEAFRDTDILNAITRKPLRANDEEIRRNGRSRSARLRVAERIVPDKISKY
ncbi:MAG: 16S rRNA (cytosine(1402)-N(4))-methyltransferase RsmH [Planctomycetia bacterium]|nr:16S rRNA (cytosine(1402)-N(4))-methyltransferase RsmH [Planctomycetia bacterium]